MDEMAMKEAADYPVADARIRSAMAKCQSNPFSLKESIKLKIEKQKAELALSEELLQLLETEPKLSRALELIGNRIY